MRKLILLLSLVTPLFAQHPEDTTPERPPSIVYDQTMHPFDTTRADANNWSETELAALGTAVHEASHECERLEKTAYEGEELFSLARLCGVGLNWPGAYSASVRYVRVEDGKPAPEHVAQGYYLLVQSLLNLQRLSDVVTTLDEISKKLPLNAQTAAVFDLAIDGLSVPQLNFALKAAATYQPLLLECIHNSCDGLSATQAQVRAYTNLSLLRNAQKISDANTGLAVLDAVIAEHKTPPSPAETYVADMARRRYLALEKPFPKATPLPRPKGNTGNTIYTAPAASANLYLFVPETCGGCKALLQQTGTMSKGLNDRATVRIALLHSEIPADPAALQPLSSFSAALVPEEFVRGLGITDTPAIVVTDKQDRVRFISSVDTNWFIANGRALLVLDRVVGDQETKEEKPDK
ncbi:hypothetical protein FTW19_24835 [Terriglobus albidus]|uniref:Thioredoxin domain-containing protein n=1 Tax=Terriglobus albidus TaxID=1592106 RepID=A0A5B9EFT4_9BACT|nr:hypothetical protein [Terriglobus albidus]QEE30942.1 hypothetical protein FTW19_24835 [Terriglobus albidus]